MNCRSFQNQLFEYLDGTLSPEVMAAAEKHLVQCQMCRDVLLEERKRAKDLGTALQSETASCTLGSKARTGILMAAKRNPVPPTVPEILRSLWQQFSVRAALVACVLVLAAAMLAAHFSSTETGKALRLSRQSASQAVSVHMAYRVPACYFHQEGNQVIDTVTYETIVASGFLLPGTQSTDTHKP